jgi:hypothetical protein
MCLRTTGAVIWNECFEGQLEITHGPAESNRGLTGVL